MFVARPEFASIRDDPRNRRVLQESIAERQRLKKNPEQSGHYDLEGKWLVKDLLVT
jgi:hypothetical protein